MKYKWNYKIFIRNIFILIFMIVIFIISMKLIIIGLNNEVEVNTYNTRVFLKEELTNVN